jgi:hypothetical protein
VVLAASEAAASEAAVPEEVGSQKLLRDLPRCRKSLKSLYLYKKHAMRYPHLIIPILFLFLWQCTPQLQERYAQAEDLSYRLESTPAKSANTLKRNPCFTNESYIPMTPTTSIIARSSMYESISTGSIHRIAAKITMGKKP